MSRVAFPHYPPPRYIYTNYLGALHLPKQTPYADSRERSLQVLGNNTRAFGAILRRKFGLDSSDQEAFADALGLGVDESTNNDFARLLLDLEEDVALLFQNDLGEFSSKMTAAVALCKIDQEFRHYISDSCEYAQFVAGVCARLDTDIQIPVGPEEQWGNFCGRLPAALLNLGRPFYFSQKARLRKHGWVYFPLHLLRWWLVAAGAVVGVWSLATRRLRGHGDGAGSSVDGTETEDLPAPPTQAFRWWHHLKACVGGAGRSSVHLKACVDGAEDEEFLHHPLLRNMMTEQRLAVRGKDNIGAGRHSSRCLEQ